MRAASARFLSSCQSGKDRASTEAGCFPLQPGQLGLGRWGWGPCPDQWLDKQTRDFPITGNLCRRLEGEGLSMSHGEVTKLVTWTAS